MGWFPHTASVHCGAERKYTPTSNSSTAVVSGTRLACCSCGRWHTCRYWCVVAGTTRISSGTTSVGIGACRLGAQALQGSSRWAGPGGLVWQARGRLPFVATAVWNGNLLARRSRSLHWDWAACPVRPRPPTVALVRAPKHGMPVGVWSVGFEFPIACASRVAKGSGHILATHTPWPY